MCNQTFIDVVDKLETLLFLFASLLIPLLLVSKFTGANPFSHPQRHLARPKFDTYTKGDGSLVQSLLGPWEHKGSQPSGVQVRLMPSPLSMSLTWGADRLLGQVRCADLLIGIHVFL